MDSTKSHRIDIYLVEVIRISTNKSVFFFTVIKESVVNIIFIYFILYNKLHRVKK